MDPRQLIQRLAQLKQEVDAITQQLAAAGIPQEAVMAALSGQGGGPQMGGQMPPQMQPGMGAGRGPDLPPGIPQGMPEGLLGGM
mgnify:FL=1|tara:strand:+ start:246 stop:497 length:252 start_codon:yes stop_codon:yes gene_type:complete